MKPPAGTKIRSGAPRAFDVLLSAVLLVLFSPVLLLAALAITGTSRGPVIFRQKRAGRGGVPFSMLKLRTMQVSTGGPRITADGDLRITAVGKFLRRMKIDELPALWNVLRGEMALVGPRPELAAYVDLTDLAWQEVLLAKPGLTDPITTSLRNEQSILASVPGDREHFYRTVLVPYKLSGYLEYLTTRSWHRDLRILLQTAVAILIPSSAPEPKFPGLHREHVVGPRRVLSLLGPTSLKERAAAAMRAAALLWRKKWLIALDGCILAAAFSAAYLLRYDFEITQGEIASFHRQILYVTALEISCLALAGAYAVIWRYFGMAEWRIFAQAAAVSCLALVLIRLGVRTDGWRVPLSIIVIDVAFGFGGVVALRVVRRIAYERFERKVQLPAPEGHRQVLLIGAGRAGRAMMAEIQSDRPAKVKVRGFVDDDPAKKGMHIFGCPVLGTVEDLQWLVKEHGIDHVMITLVRASRPELRRIMQICDAVPVKVQVLPSLWELIHEKVGVSRIKDFDICQVLGREPVTLLGENVRDAVRGRIVMVTGAGGSIGSELVRQIAHCDPALLLLVERAEPALFNIHHEIAESFPHVAMAPLLADATNRFRMEDIFACYKPEIVIHAAAHKHVPMLELNICDGVLNNVIGSRLIGELCGRYRAGCMVLISSDKAVRPNSVLGATKRVAELLVQDLNYRYDCRYLAVRFGNVIGSAGSVIPVFREQIRKGGPVTVTDADMVRYFMTIQEASQLVLEAMTLKDNGDIYVLDMGKPVKILSLARDVIRLCGLRPYEDIDIVFTGIRSGEKLAESLEGEGESLSRTGHPKILIGSIVNTRQTSMQTDLAEMERLAFAGDGVALRRLLSAMLPEASLQPEPAAPLLRRDELHLTMRAV